MTLLLAPVKDGLIVKRVLSISGEMESAVKLEQEAGSFRMCIWKETIKLLPEYWALGMGPDNLYHADIRTPNGSLADKVHNIYLEIAVTMGIFALLAYLVFLMVILKPHPGEGGFLFFIMLLTYLIQGFFNIDVISVMPLFWIVLGLTYNHKYKNPVSEPGLYETKDFFNSISSAHDTTRHTAN